MKERLVEILVNRDLVAQEDVDEALQRQLVDGGSLDTKLLEMGLCTETDLLLCIGEAYDLPTAGKEEIDQVSGHIPRLFPLVFAETYRLVPFCLVDQSFVVLLNGPPDENLFARIHERLQLHIAPTAAVEVRLHYAMCRLYGTELLPRYANLLERLDGSVPNPEDALVPLEGDHHVLSWGVSRARIFRKAAGPAPGLAMEGLLERLDGAIDRDTIVETLLRSALETFEFAAMFLVQAKNVNGWRGTDPESTQRLSRISLSVQLPSVFQTIYATGGHYLGPLPENTANNMLLQAMERDPPRTALLAPVVVGERLAAILYADNGGRGIPSKRVAGMVLLAQRAGLCFERMIRRRKQGEESAPTPAAVETAPAAITYGHDLELIDEEHIELVDLSGEDPPTQGPPPRPPEASAPEVEITYTVEEEHPDLADHQATPHAADGRESAETEIAEFAVDDEDDEHDEHDQYEWDEAGMGRPLFQLDNSPEAVQSDLEAGIVLAGPPPAAPSRQEASVDTGAATEIVDAASSPAEADEPYVAFAELDNQSPESALGDWEDVLLDAVSNTQDDDEPIREPPPPSAARATAVTWEDVISEAERAAETKAPQKIEVAGTVVDESELLLDGLDAEEPATRQVAVSRLLELGTAIDEKLTPRVPGRFNFDPLDVSAVLPPFERINGVAQFLAVRGASAAPVVLPHLESTDPAARFFAVYYFLTVHYPPAISALAKRLYDREPRNRYLAADALRSYATEAGYRDIVQSLRGQLKLPEIDARVNCIQVLGQLREPTAVPSLIPLTVATEPAVAAAAGSALAVICAQALGADVARWAEWWQSHYNQPRVSWLINSLRHTSPAVARIAGSELQLLTGHAMPFDPEGDPRQKEAVIMAWENWWQQSQGRRQFETAQAAQGAQP